MDDQIFECFRIAQGSACHCSWLKKLIGKRLIYCKIGTGSMNDEYFVAMLSCGFTSFGGFVQVINCVLLALAALMAALTALPGEWVLVIAVYSAFATGGSTALLQAGSFAVASRFPAMYIQASANARIKNLATVTGSQPRSGVMAPAKHRWKRISHSNREDYNSVL